MALQPFPEPWAGTREALHRYVREVVSLARAHASPEPAWGHRGLRITDDRLSSAPVTLPGGGEVVASLCIPDHRLIVTTSGGEAREWTLGADDPGAVGAGIAAYAADLGLSMVAPSMAAALPAPYDRGVAEAFWAVLRDADALVSEAVRSCSGWATPTRFWPHGFDLSAVWFGGDGHPEGPGAESASRFTIGFDPAAARRYFYANPWPFDPALVETPLPPGASWHTEGWEGSMLPYEAAGSRDQVIEYVAAVYAAAAPTL